MIGTPQRVMDRLFDRVNVRNSDECWPWKLSAGGHGYAQVGWWADGRSQMRLVHRLIYNRTRGHIWSGYEVDHRCRNRICCNPSHLRLLPDHENHASNGQALRTRCPQGHEYTPENTHITSKGHRCCRQCARDRNADRYVGASA